MSRIAPIVGCAALCLVLTCCGVPMQDSPTLLTPTFTSPEPVPTTTQQPDAPSTTPSTTAPPRPTTAT